MPAHFSQAPNGLLKENMRGESSLMADPVLLAGIILGETHLLVRIGQIYDRDPAAESERGFQRIGKAALGGPASSTSRSTTISIVCFLFLSSAGTSSREYT